MPTPGFPSSFGSRPGRGSRKEETRDVLLEKVKAEREQRSQIRQRSKAAVVVQRHWRGWQCRSRARKDLVAGWKSQYAGAVASVSTAVPASTLFEHVVPVLLFLFWPTRSSRTLHCLQTGGHLDATKPEGQAVPVVKGTLALLIRSVASQNAADNYCSYAVHELPAVRKCWQWQCCRLLQLCSCLICGTSGSADPLLDTACARVTSLLLDPSQWKMPSLPADAANAAVQAVLRLACQSPAPLFAAARRALNAPGQPKPESVTSSASKSATSAGSGPASQIPQRTLAAAMKLLRASPDSMAQHYVQAVLTVPNCTKYLPASTREDLTKQELTKPLLTALQKLASSQKLTASQAAAAAANIFALLAVGSCRSDVAGGGRRAVFVMLQPASHLDDPVLAVQYMLTVAALVACTLRGLRALSGPQKSEQAAAVADAVLGWWPLADRLHLQQLIATMQDYTLQAEPSERRAKAMEEEALGMVQLSKLFVDLLTHLPLLQAELVASAPPDTVTPSDVPSVLNTLAFSPTFLPKLWHWLAVNLGLPLEAHVEATRGLDILALSGGFTSLVPGLAAAMGLYCRVLQHLLLVLDDTEFYELQKPFTLGQSRAMATSLNTLVFHTFFPAQGMVTRVGSGRGPAYDLLGEYSPLALRALYERDVRRAFCQPQLWVAPYSAMTGDQVSGVKGDGVRIIGGFNAEAVVAALTGGKDDDEGEETSLQAEHGAGRRPASLAALLRVAPQCVPFTHRVELFRVLLGHIRTRGGYHLPPIEGGPPPIQVTIRREALMDDAFSTLAGRGLDLRRRLMVSFVNAAGLLEAGLDQGGLMKEFLEQVVQTGLGGGYGLFQATAQGLAYPCPTADKLHMGLQLLEFLGLAVGKALYEGILLEAAFAPFFTSRLQGRTATFDDLLSLDPSLHRSLTQVKRYDGEVEDLGLSFTAEHEFFGKTISHELLPGRGSHPVTNANRLLYVHLLADWHLNSRLGRPAESFARGLSSIIPLTSLRLFNPYEFNELVSGGSDGGVDVEDMRQFAKYSGGYSELSPAIRLFWKVVAAMTAAERSELLKFVTSCSRAPLGGFQHLQPPLTIHKVDCDASVFALVGGKDVDRLPSASTCYNMLKLPNYRRAATMREKLLYAIRSGAGFELS